MQFVIIQVSPFRARVQIRFREKGFHFRPENRSLQPFEKSRNRGCRKILFPCYGKRIRKQTAFPTTCIPASRGTFLQGDPTPARLFTEQNPRIIGIFKKSPRSPEFPIGQNLGNLRAVESLFPQIQLPKQSFMSSQASQPASIQILLPGGNPVPQNRIQAQFGQKRPVQVLRRIPDQRFLLHPEPIIHQRIRCPERFHALCHLPDRSRAHRLQDRQKRQTNPVPQIKFFPVCTVFDKSNRVFLRVLQDIRPPGKQQRPQINMGPGSRTRLHTPQAFQATATEKIDEKSLDIVIGMVRQQAGVQRLRLHPFREISIAELPGRHFDRNFLLPHIGKRIKRPDKQPAPQLLRPRTHKGLIPFRLIPTKMEIAMDPIHRHIMLLAIPPHQMREDHRIHSATYGKEQPLASRKKPLLFNISQELPVHTVVSNPGPIVDAA